MSVRSFRRQHEREQRRQHKRRAGIAKRAALTTTGALGATVVFAPGAHAATFTVDTLADVFPANSCDPGDCTLRDAVAAANDITDNDTIVFASGLSGTITLDNAAIQVNDAVTIQGPGADQITVSADDSSRIFALYNFASPGEDVSISGLTLANGNTGNRGGALINGAGVAGDGANLTIADTVLTGNHAGSHGGAVYSDDGTLAIVRSTLTDNEAVGSGRGGAVYVEDTAGSGGNEVVISDSVISGNRTEDDGGGVYISDADGAILVERTTISGNTADLDVGGLNIAADEDAGPLTVVDSTFSDNSSGQAGGGIWLLRPGGPVTIANSTFAGNTAYYGGAINSDNGYDEPVTIANSTIVDNSATSTLYGGGGIFRFASDDPGSDGDDTLTLSSTIVANNTAPVGPDISDTNGQGDGSFVLGFSLVEDTSGAIASENPAGSNINGQDPALGPLTDNGGPTQTQLPSLSSPVLEAGIANGLTADQRALARTFDASNIANTAGSDGTDIGAVELAAQGTCKGKAATVLFAPGLKINGSSGNDVIVGTDQKDKVNSGGGKDTVCAGAGNDKVKGGAGNDKVKGGAGKDKLSGQAGKDKLSGNGGKDTLKGGSGKDKLVGGPGKDKLSGGGGKDIERQ